MMRRSLFSITAYLLFALFGFTHSALALDVQNIRFGQHSDKVRIVMDVSGQTRVKTSVLENPDRIVVDTNSFAWKIDRLKIPPFAKVKALRHGQLEQGGRVVFEFDNAVRIAATFSLPPDGKGSGHRIIVDYRVGATQLNSKPTPAPVVANTELSPIPSPIKKPKEAEIKLSKKPLIVIDPGHGGIDPGAVGRNGVYEKNITLQVSKKLRRALEQTGKYKVVLTRDRDVFLKLYDRVKLARAVKADLFISIHADSIDDKKVRGSSVYTLSNKASDEQTARLARRENQADLIAGIDLSTEDEDVADILIDLTLRDTSNQSKFFANTLVSSFQNIGIRTLKKPHRSAGFAVLKAPDIPSVLIECGFISNAQEAKLLTQENHQNKIVKSLLRGVNQYFIKVEENKKS